jgi:hypothetical protein
LPLFLRLAALSAIGDRGLFVVSFAAAGRQAFFTSLVRAFWDNWGLFLALDKANARTSKQTRRQWLSATGGIEPRTATAAGIGLYVQLLLELVALWLVMNLVWTWFKKELLLTNALALVPGSGV